MYQAKNGLPLLNISLVMFSRFSCNSSLFNHVQEVAKMEEEKMIYKAVNSLQCSKLTKS